MWHNLVSVTWLRLSSWKSRLAADWSKACHLQFLFIFLFFLRFHWSLAFCLWFRRCCCSSCMVEHTVYYTSSVDLMIFSSLLLLLFFIFLLLLFNRCSCWRKGTCAWLTPPANLSFIQQRDREGVREGVSVAALHWRARGNGSRQAALSGGRDTQRGQQLDKIRAGDLTSAGFTSAP